MDISWVFHGKVGHIRIISGLEKSLVLFGAFGTRTIQAWTQSAGRQEGFHQNRCCEINGLMQKVIFGMLIFQGS